METRVSSHLAHAAMPRQAVNLDAHGKLGPLLGALEKLESRILLELKALCEGTWKMGEFTAFSQHLVMQATLELHILLKVVPKVHLELQMMLIDVQQYKPTRVVVGASAVPKELDFMSTTAGK